VIQKHLCDVISVVAEFMADVARVDAVYVSSITCPSRVSLLTLATVDSVHPLKVGGAPCAVWRSSWTERVAQGGWCCVRCSWWKRSHVFYDVIWSDVSLDVSLDMSLDLTLDLSLDLSLDVSLDLTLDVSRCNFFDASPMPTVATIASLIAPSSMPLQCPLSPRSHNLLLPSFRLSDLSAPTGQNCKDALTTRTNWLLTVQSVILHHHQFRHGTEGRRRMDRLSLQWMWRRAR